MRIVPRDFPAGGVPLLVMFVINGALLSGWFVLIPTVQANLGLTEAELGAALWGLGGGLLAGTVASERLMPRFGVRAIAVAGILGYCVTVAFPGLAWSQLTLLVALAFPGFFNGLMEPPCYVIADRLKQAWNEAQEAAGSLDKREVTGYTLGAFSIAQIVAPLIAAQAVRLAVPPWAYLSVMALVCLVVAIIACKGLPDFEHEVEHDTWRQRPRWYVWALAVSLLAAAGFVTEGIWAEWHGVYLSGSGIDAALGDAALAYPAFQAGVAVTRLGYDALARRVGNFRLALASAVVVLVGALVIVNAQSLPVAIIGAIVLGLGAGPVVSIAFSAAGSNPKAVTMVSMLGYTSLLSAPPLIGFAAEAVGMRTALYAWFGLVLLMVVTSLAVRSRRTADGDQAATAQ